MSENDFPLVSPEPPDSDTTDKEEESHFTSPEQLRRHSPIASLITPIEQHDSTLESTDLLSVSPADSTSTLSLKSTSLVSSLFIEPISNVVVTPTTPPQLGNLWQALRSVRIATLLYSSVVTVMASLSFGYGIGFSSPTLHDLDENEGKHTYFRRTIYHDSFNAITPVGCVCGAAIAGWLVDYSGRHFTLVMCSLPYTIGWFLILISDLITGHLFRPLLLTGRFINGMGIGAASLVVPLYIAEISPESLRGLFGSMNQLAVTVGTLLVQALGIKLDYVWLSVVGIILMVVFAPLASWTLKESPRWLVIKGERTKAINTLHWLRGSDYDIDLEVQEIETQLASEEKSLAETVRTICSLPVLHPIILSVLLMFFQDFVGYYAVIFNGEEIFEGAGVSNAAVITFISIGLVQFIATFIGAFLTDIFGRKLLLIIGSITMCLGMMGLSAYDFLKNEPYCDPPDDSKCKNNLEPLAISAMIVYMSGFSIGWGALPWLMTSEMIPTRVKGPGVGIVTCISWVFTVIVLSSFGSYEEVVKPWGTFLTFAIFSLISLFFIAIFLPETKGKSLEEIERRFNRNRNQYIPL